MKKKTDPFSARLPQQNILPFPEADRREAEEKKSILSKGAKKCLKIGQIQDAKVQKTDCKMSVSKLKIRLAKPNLDQPVITELLYFLSLTKHRIECNYSLDSKGSFSL